MDDPRMQEVDKNEYARMKDFLSFFAQRYLNADGLLPEKRPIAVLDALEEKSLKIAFKGPRQAINDCVEMSFHLNSCRSGEIGFSTSNSRDCHIV